MPQMPCPGGKPEKQKIRAYFCAGFSSGITQECEYQNHSEPSFDGAVSV
jgi:hypothetical protein